MTHPNSTGRLRFGELTNGLQSAQLGVLSFIMAAVPRDRGGVTSSETMNNEPQNTHTVDTIFFNNNNNII